METSVLIVKPEAAASENNIVYDVKQAGLRILQRRRLQLTREQADDYLDILDTPQAEQDPVALSSGPIVVLLLQGHNAIDALKQLVGPISATNDKTVMAPTSLRAKYTRTASNDGFCTSDSAVLAQRQAQFFFPDNITDPLPETDNVKAFLEDSLYPVLTKGLTRLCKEKPENPTAWLGKWLLQNNPNKPQVFEPSD
ncbi:nucleoside-diphosphate kinase [Synchytrium endobioticum]|uniref:Nucleoside diphosphate kinase n=1 Tax=Synchytrium endobioticum TaxID=286115 RepID=A0A507D384_9FUNG|nr:nucleoside-diphosphate kinase [Synchytrium endobioticum]